MNRTNLIKLAWQDPRYFIALGFGLGLLPRAPGTWGTLAALPIYFLMVDVSPWLYLSIIAAAFFLGVFICDFVSKALGEEDPAIIVWDEVVGYLLTLFLAPKGFIWLILGFGLFRLFDIWKPYPICFIDKKVNGGIGIMLDDVLAAIPAWILLQLLAWSLA